MANKYPRDWFVDSTEAAQDSLNLMGQQNNQAIAAVDSIGKEEEGGGMVDRSTFWPSFEKSFGLGQGISTKLGETKTAVGEALVSEETVDKIIPGLSIVVGEGISKAVRRDWKWPKGWSKRIRAGGKHAFAYKLALDATSLVGSQVDKWNEAHPNWRLKRGPTTGLQMGGAYTAYKLASKFAFNMTNSMKIGMVAEVFDDVMIDAGEKVAKQVVKEYGTSRASQTAGRLLAKKASEKAGAEVAENLVKQIGKKSAMAWDEVGKALLNPKRAAKVGQWLARNGASRLGKRIALSATMTVIPEGWSTVFGIAGLGWAAWDLFNLIKVMPNADEIRSILFEDAPPSETTEDVIVNEMNAADSLNMFGPQNLPQE